MNRTVSFYDPSTGELAPLVFNGPEWSVELNVPPGHVAIDGKHDRRTHRVVDGKVVARDAPIVEPSDAMAERARVLSQMRVLEAKQHRPLRALALDPSDSDAKARLQSLEEAIAALRSVLPAHVALP